MLLDAIVGKDARDPSTRDADSHRSGFFDGLNGLKANELRLGIAKEYTGYHERADSLFAVAVAALRAAGATIVDDVSVGDPDLIRPSERLVMEYEFKAGLNAYLATRTSGSVPKDLDAIIRFNQQNADSVMPHFAQEIHLRAQARGNLDDDAYLSARAASLELAGAKGIDLSLRTHGLDALIAPTSTPAWLIDWIGGDNRRGGASCGPAVAGYPHVSVPMGFVEHLPVGLSVFAGAYQDMKVLQIAHLFEQIRGPL